MAVGPEGGLTMGELASRMGITQGAVSQLAARLERKGYLLRSKSAQDRRQTVATLTEKGKRLCAEHIAYDVESFSFPHSPTSCQRERKKAMAAS